MESVAHVSGADPPRLPLSDFSFELPPELIAQEPALTRTAARLLVWDRHSGAVTHTHVAELPGFVQPGDLFVFNDTKVMPARLYGRTVSGAAIELLVIRPEALLRTASTNHQHDTWGCLEHDTWQCLGRPRRRLCPGTKLRFAGGATASVTSATGGRCGVAFDTDDVPGLLARQGEVPLPPYIKRADGPLPFDRERYQTVFAAQPGAVAAPTAGLHFTQDLLADLRRAGAALAYLTLHVGPGTFLPVRHHDLARHHMEAEWCAIPTATADLVNQARRQGRRVVAVGTTTTRALESAADETGAVVPGTRWAERFIRPGDRFRVVDALFTNFHLPGSTLLALVSAFAGRERTLAIYADAVRCRYRFYSYGDAMLIQ